MKRYSNYRAAGLAGMLIVMAGCTSTSAPTHRWEADVSNDQYRRDNYRCAPGGAPRVRYPSRSEEFSSYRQCMETKGYHLVAASLR